MLSDIKYYLYYQNLVIVAIYVIYLRGNLFGGTTGPRDHALKRHILW